MVGQRGSSLTSSRSDPPPAYYLCVVFGPLYGLAFQKRTSIGLGVACEPAALLRRLKRSNGSGDLSMHVLMTGAAGWLGRHLCPLLRQSGHSVVGLDVVAARNVDVVASVADRGAIEALFSEHRFDAVVH